MIPMEVEHMFSFVFEKPSAEIVEKAKIKADCLRSKIEERQIRIAKLREEYKVTDAILVDLLTQARNAQRRGEAKMSYSVQNTAARTGGINDEVVIGAGVVNNLLTESDFIEAEKTQVKRLDLIIRNLRDLPRERNSTMERGHVLSYEELEYLGF